VIFIKWADYLITKVRYNDKSNFIEYLEIRKDKEFFVGDGELKRREKIIEYMKEGASFFTANKVIKNDKTLWIKGKKVHLLNIFENYYIRTDELKLEKDYLENLDEM
jgi:hypothetical protein